MVFTSRASLHLLLLLFGLSTRVKSGLAFAITGVSTNILLDRILRISKENSQLSLSASDEGVSAPVVALNVILRIKPEVREKFLEVILNNQKGTLDKELEPLALEYTFGEDSSEPNTFHFHEKYLGEEGIAAHNAAPHFLVWEEFAQTNPFTSPPEVYKFTIYGSKE